MTVFLINPAHKRRKKASAAKPRRKMRKVPNGFRTWPEYMASIRPGSKKKKVNTNPKRKTMAKRKRRASTAKKTTTRRRRYRRNPPIGKQLTSGVMDGVGVTLGKVASRVVASKLPLPPTGPAALAAQVAVAVGVAMIAQHLPIGNAKMKEMVAAGAFASAMESTIRNLNIPVISPALSSYPTLASYPNLAALPMSARTSRTWVPPFANS